MTKKKRYSCEILFQWAPITTDKHRHFSFTHRYSENPSTPELAANVL